MQNNKIFFKMMCCILVYTTFIAKIIPQMKHLFCICFLLASNLHAQDVFKRYATHSEVTHLNVSPQMFQLLSKFKVSTSDPKSQAFIIMIQSLRHFRVMSTKNAQISLAMEEWLKKEIDQTALESVLNLTEKGVKVQFAAVYGEDEATVNRLLMYVQGLQDYMDNEASIQLNTETRFDFVLLEIAGKIDLNQVALITQLVEIPGGRYLEVLKD